MGDEEGVPTSRSESPFNWVRRMVGGSRYSGAHVVPVERHEFKAPITTDLVKIGRRYSDLAPY
jgi:hypothetical protein